MKSILMFTIDIVLVILGTLLALVLRYDFDLPMERLQDVLPFLAFTVFYAAFAIIGFGQHRTIWRLSAASDFRRGIAVAVLTVAGATLSMFVVNRLDGIPRSLPMLLSSGR